MAHYEKENIISNTTVAAALDKMVRILMLMCLVMHIIYLIAFIRLGIMFFIVFNFFSVILYYYLFTHKFHITPNRHYFALVAEIMAHMSLAVIFFGWDFGFQYFIVFLFTAIYVKIISSIKHMNVYAIAEMVVFIGLRIYTYNFDPIQADVVTSLTMQCICIFNMLIFFVGMFILAKAVTDSNLLYRSILSKDNAELEELAQEDFLTGLANRRSLYNQYEYMKYRSKGEFSCCIAMGDIDDFKQINDEFGHDVGDAILVQISQIIKSMTRDQDIVCRWGGEEIVIIMPNIPKNLAQTRLELMRQRIEESNVKIRGEEVYCTITFGLYYHYGEGDLEQLVAKADQLLYQGKRNGKNQVVSV